MRAVRRDLRLILLLAAASWAAAPALAVAQGRLEAHYTASLAGIPIGKGTWVIDVTDTHYKAAASGATTGLVRIFVGGHGATYAHGKLSGGRPTSTVFSSTITAGAKVDEVKIETRDGNVTDMIVKPPQDKKEERIPITKEHQRGVIDPMTAMLLRTPGTGNALSEEACRRTLAVFDGRLRYDLRLEFKRIDHVKAEKGYSGPVVVCRVRFVPIAGYIPSRSAIKYITKLRDIEAWLAPIMGTRVLVPFQIQGPTPIGEAMMRATEFVSVATPSRAAAGGASTQ